MMSQIEIRNMQNYCLRRNYEQDREYGRRTGIRTIGAERSTVNTTPVAITIFIMGLIIMAISLMLTIYVVKSSIAMTGMIFLVTGIAGTVAGVAAMILAMKLNKIL